MDGGGGGGEEKEGKNGEVELDIEGVMTASCGARSIQRRRWEKQDREEWEEKQVATREILFERKDSFGRSVFRREKKKVPKPLFRHHSTFLGIIESNEAQQEV